MIVLKLISKMIVLNDMHLLDISWKNKLSPTYAQHKNNQETFFENLNWHTSKILRDEPILTKDWDWAQKNNFLGIDPWSSQQQNIADMGN